MPAVNWGTRPSKKTATPTEASALDKFVNPESNKSSKRLNAQIPADLHARIKAQCAMEGRDMTEVLIELLEARFPSK